jgi:hypothetical protein
MKETHAIVQSKSSGQLSAGQRALSIGYSIIFALILPLICWGAYATPGHPHRIPHFVFVEPTLKAPAPKPVVALSPSMPGHEHHNHSEMMPMAPASEDPTPEPNQRVAGRASLSLLLFSILIFVAVDLWLYRKIDERQQRRFILALFVKPAVLPILLPPPRIAVSLTA